VKASNRSSISDFDPIEDWRGEGPEPPQEKPYHPDDDAHEFVVLGRCPHGVDLDREFCPEGCRV
jgi:hypothetical protein